MPMTKSDGFSPRILLDIYRRALLIQLFDERMRSLISTGRMAAVYYSPRGQEILAAAMGVNLEPTDYLVTTYRGVHDQLAKGMPLRQMVAEYAGKATGACKGKGGAMHITYPKAGIMVTTGVVGSGLPIANGLALASQLKGDGRVTLCNFGDGASNIGAFHEALNMASLWKLPVIFLCQNNHFAECTRYADGTTVAHVADRAASYSMRGVTVDGNDPEAMWQASREAVTFRFMGHYFGDPGAYIPKDEYAAALARDPMAATKAAVLQTKAASEADLETMARDINAQIDDAVQFAADSSPPEPDEINRDIYAPGPLA